MSGMDQYALLLPIVNQAVDFLFDEVRTILKERRGSRARTSQEPHTTSNVVTNKNELSGKVINRDNLIGDEAKELQHCIDQIKQYRKNRRMLEEQIGKVGGRTHASISLLNQLEDTESEIDNWSKKLKELIEKIYGCEISLA
ncbi:MAG TPA: hypothetical protein VJ785_11060 [Anaerolineales bacterium]|nr:hypothetical protein [Anaerolineales bacterium]